MADVNVGTTDEGVTEIQQAVSECINGMRREFGTQGVSQDMIDCCHQYADPIIANFANQNRDGETQGTVLVEKWVLEHGTTEWTKECQTSIEIDADQRNAKLNQRGHVGCEIYFANKERCIEKTKEDWKAGRRILKMHAYLPEGQDPPHYRHEDGGSGEDPNIEPPRTTPEQRVAGPDLQVMYRCTVRRQGFTE
ncbi:hypothetical protein GYMLUDRAFT_244056 [Collybiopsis luxurians FD-317 M1]|uniref:Uncharacterized protein n=1 Tax=Collybiopsis luxurians FD-317 M1 TaxID=944289 RepID=A0A0D0CXF2_9AGAR|nr:hypothetical protein GYMLUDRAFT_244056 [Collybiopsis luxurians FD-317 M1]